MAIKANRKKITDLRHRYCSDRPVSSPSEDQLGYGPFAERLATDIREWNGDESLVVGLYGGWGSGKTSLKNLVLWLLNKRGTKMPVVEFNPWILPASSSMLYALFAEIRAKLDLGIGASDRTHALDEYLNRLLVPGTKPLSEAQDQLAEALGSLKKPMVIVVDEIDRLQPAGILEVLQLVKVQANFPNLIFLLLCDRSIVAKSIDPLCSGRGAELLEKVIQTGYFVPHAPKSLVQKSLFNAIEELLQIPGMSRRWQLGRWSNLYFNGLAAYFRVPRHVKRFLASLEFHVRQFRSDEHFEVNPVDLVGLEALRVFEPLIYERLTAAKRILTRDGGPFREIVRQDVVDNAVEEILLSQTGTSGADVRFLLEELFPPILQAFGDKEGLSKETQSWMREARVCHADFFDRYFSLRVEEGTLSQADFDRLLDAAPDVEAFDARLEDLSKRGLLRAVFQRLDASKEDIPLLRLPSLFRSLTILGDDVPEKTPGANEVDILALAARIIYHGLNREPNEQQRFELLHEAFVNSTGLLLPIYVTGLQERVTGVSNNREHLIADAHWEGLKELCLVKLRNASRDGRLRAHPRPSMLLLPWVDWAPKDARAWVAEQMETPGGGLWFLGSLLSESRQRGKETPVYSLRFGLVERFIHPRVLETALDKIETSSLDQKEQIAIIEFKKGMERRNSGVTQPKIGILSSPATRS